MSSLLWSCILNVNSESVSLSQPINNNKNKGTGICFSLQIFHLTETHTACLLCLSLGNPGLYCSLWGIFLEICHEVVIRPIRRNLLYIRRCTQYILPLVHVLSRKSSLYGWTPFLLNLLMIFCKICWWNTCRYSVATESKMLNMGSEQNSREPQSFKINCAISQNFCEARDQQRQRKDAKSTWSQRSLTDTYETLMSKNHT